MASFGSMTPQMGNANQVLSAPTELNQVGPGAPNFQPGMLPPPPQGAMGAPPPQGMPQAPQMAPMPGAQPVPSAIPQAPQAQMGQPQGTVGLPPGQQEAQMILKALISRLGHQTKGEEMARGQV